MQEVKELTIPATHGVGIAYEVPIGSEILGIQAGYNEGVLLMLQPIDIGEERVELKRIFIVKSNTAIPVVGKYLGSFRLIDSAFPHNLGYHVFEVD